MKKILFIIPPERFRDEELFVVKNSLEKDGYQIDIASTIKGEIFGTRGGKAQATMTLYDINSNNYRAIVFVGGGGSRLLFNNEKAQYIAKEFYKSDKAVAAICLAPVILANAGILKGVKSTVAGTEARTIEKQGAKYAGPGVFADKKIITANGPKSSQLFAKTIDVIIKDSRKYDN